MTQIHDITPETFISDSLALLMGNFFSLLGHSAGSGFPSLNLREGMFFLHTTQKKIYVLASVSPTAQWKELLDLNRLLSSSTDRVAYLDEVAQALSEKQDTVTGAASSVLTNNLSANKAVATDTDGKLVALAVTVAELGRLAGVSSNVQQQLNGKQNAITVSTAVPTAADGVNGDIWLVME